mmetsp:Transcript_7090/g.11262  ORF Transcript_7090/g.11262 Transcript_7090/m.11262 type:complete len:153 (+) Transcript_7090:352-810(+)
MPFKQMENIANFLKGCRERLHMKEYDLFTTADLYDGKSIVNVTNGLVAFSRAATKAGYAGTCLGPKESTARKSKTWDINPNASVSKLSQGSVATMDKTHIDMSSNVTFGADNSKEMWGSSEVSKMNQGSSETMQKTEISRSNDITFGANAGR